MLELFKKRLPNYLLGECPSRFVYDVSKSALGMNYNKARTY